MQKEIHELSDRALLEELVRETRRARQLQKIRNRVWLAAAAVLLVLCLIYVPRAVRTVQRYNAAIDRVNQVTDQIEVVLGGVGELDAEKLRETAEEAGQALRRVRELLDGINTEQLHDTLDRLNDISEQAKGFFDGVSGNSFQHFQETLEELNGHLSDLQSLLHIFQ